MFIDKSHLGKRRYQPKQSTCCICKRPIIQISKIKIKGNKYIYHCEACSKAAQEYAEVLIEDYSHQPPIEIGGL